MLNTQTPALARIKKRYGPTPDLATYIAAVRENQQIVADKWWLGGILVERFITRFFVEVLHILPDWTKYLDYPLLVLFAIYVFSTARYRLASSAKTGFMALVLCLVIVVALSALVNIQRLQFGAIGLFILGFFEPLAFMGLAYMLGPSRSLAAFIVRVLLVVGWIQVAVVMIYDLPVYLRTGNPDVISGTFGENAYQLTFFLLTWNVLVLRGAVGKKMSAPKLLGVGLLQIVIVVIIFLAQFRSILPFAVLTWMLTYFVTIRGPGKTWGKAVLTGMVGLIVFVTLFSQLIALVPQLKWADALQLADRSSETLDSGKVQSVLSYGQLISEQPALLLVGTGPATYASRGFQTFSLVGRRDTINVLYRNLFHTGYYVTDVAAIHTLPFVRLYAFGSATIATPWFSFLAIPAEIGLSGLVIILLIYRRAIVLCWRVSTGTDDISVIARWVLISLVLLLQMGFLGNWLEVSRLTVPVWIVFGLVLAWTLNEKGVGHTAQSIALPVTRALNLGQPGSQGYFVPILKADGRSANESAEEQL